MVLDRCKTPSQDDPGSRQFNVSKLILNSNLVPVCLQLSVALHIERNYYEAAFDIWGWGRGQVCNHEANLPAFQQIILFMSKHTIHHF